MINFIKSLPYHFKTAVKSFGRHLAMSMSAASAVTVTLSLVGVFMLLAANVSSFTTNVESGIKIRVTIDPITTKEERSSLKTQILSVDGVNKVVFSNKENELKEFVKEKGDIWDIYKGDGNPLRDAYIVDVKEDKKGDIKNISETIKKLDKVEKTFYGGDSVNDMIEVFTAIRNGGAVFIAALAVLTVFLIQNTIKMTIYARNREISIMRNVGATNWFIKTPFMIEGMFIGLIGSIIPMMLTYFGYRYIYHSMGGKFFTNMFALQSVNSLALSICGALLLFGVIVGMIGSFLSVTKYLKWKR